MNKQVYMISFNAYTLEESIAADPSATHVIHDTLTPWFENAAIVSQPLGNGYTSFLSWKFYYTATNIEGRAYQPQDIYGYGGDADVVIFGTANVANNVFVQAERVHAGIKAIYQKLFNKMGVEFAYALHYEWPIYRNYFMAKKHVWEDYITNYLKPVIAILKDTTDEEMQRMIWQKCPYPFMERRFVEFPQLRQKCIDAFGIEGYPYHPFVIERLPTLFLQSRDYKVDCI